MLPDLPFEQVAEAVDDAVAELLVAAGVVAPPIDAPAIARARAIDVAVDDRQTGRARFVRLAARRGARPRESILVSPEPRAERRQWAVAHELGEWSAARVFSRLGLAPRLAPLGARESIANLFAARLLLPSRWFAAVAAEADFDLLLLKDSFPTASHELIARRTLDLPEPAIVSVFDQGALTWRRSNFNSRPLSATESEFAARLAAHQTGLPQEGDAPAGRVRCWPVHEDSWRREIVRTEFGDLS